MTIYVSDSFTRANSSTSLGVTDTGQSWSVGSSQAWGILNNKAYCPTPINTGVAFVETGKSDISNSVKITFNTNEGIIVRLSDELNYITARISSTSLGLFKIVGNTPTSLGSYSFTPTSGTVYTVRIDATGSSIKVYLNDVLQISATDTFNQTATKSGLRSTNSAGLFDDFLVQDLATGGTDASITAVIANATASALIPSISTGNNVTSVIGSATAAGLAPQVGSITNATINAVIANATASALNPTVTAISNINLTIPVSNAVANLLAPVFGVPISVQISAFVASLVTDALSPIVTVERGSIWRNGPIPITNWVEEVKESTTWNTPVIHSF